MGTVFFITHNGHACGNKTATFLNSKRKRVYRMTCKPLNWLAPQSGWFWALGRAFIAVTTLAASFHFFQYYQPDAVS